MQFTTYALALALSLSLGLAQFPSTPSDMIVVNSQVNPEVTISYKELYKTNVCEKTAGVKSYSGFVNLPGSSLSDIGGYEIHSYFIYFEARNNASTAPLAIYLAGGPGESSIYAALASESGPCYVNVNGTDTIENPWSFNNNANVLYIDQPVQSGYSYTHLVNSTYDLLAGGMITPLASSDPASLPTVNATFGYGTYPSQDFNQTANTTVLAGKALWHFAEHWLSSFPGYNTTSNRVSIWGNSYGGYWVPETAMRFSKQLKALPVQHILTSKTITVDAIGLTNACIDFATAAAGYPEYAYNNTYGIKFGSEAVYEEAMYNLTKPGGCLDLVEQCRSLGQLSDPDFTGSNSSVNELCMGAFYDCGLNVINSFPDLQQRVAFDIAIPAPNPCEFYLPVSTYLNNGTTQAALGVPLNFTYTSNVVPTVFGLPSIYTAEVNPSLSTGDAVRHNSLPAIEYLLSTNVKIALIFGDRDYRCPWTGGEATASAATWAHQPTFQAAGYEEMQGLSTPAPRALVKQAHHLSFTRVLDAGHQVSAYAPETVYRVFERTLHGVDVAAGAVVVDAGGDDVYTTVGPTDSWSWRTSLPLSLPRTCVVAGAFQDTNPWLAVLPDTE